MFAVVCFVCWCCCSGSRKEKFRTFVQGYPFSPFTGYTDSEYGIAKRSIGDPEVLAELNDAVWNPKLMPQGEFYTIRYTQPR